MPAPDMLYNLKAKPKATELQRFWTLLNDGTICSQEPDGGEIVASMKRAMLTGGTVEWSETCYCNPPLDHEIATVYDQFFSDIEVQPQISQASLKGEQFWRYLQQTFGKTPKTLNGETLSTGVRHIPLRLV